MATRILVAALLSLAISPVAAVVRRDTEDNIKPNAATIPRQYLVEFAEPDAKSKFYSEIAGKGIRVKPKMDLSYELFHGASFKLDDKHDEAEATEVIDSLPIVKQIWPMQHYYPQAVVRRADPPTYDANQTDAFSPHVMAGVDKLHARGITGKGRHIAILDTGIDYHHPALGGGFGSGYKVTSGYDFVGDAYDGVTTEPVEDSDPYSSCNAHGSHVSGIVAASQNEYNFTGVAPDATLSMYRVFGCSGSAGDDVLIKATLMAHSERPDVISISIGGPSGWSESPWSVVTSRVVSQGTPVVLSAGNSGSDGMFTGSTAADGIGVIGVGSIDNTQLPELSQLYPYAVNNQTAGKINVAQSETPIEGIALPLYATSLDPTVANDACNPLPDSTPDLSNKIVLIRRGSCTFASKGANAAAKGAKFVLFYNNVEGLLTNAGIPPLKGVAMTRAENGAQFVKQLAAGATIVPQFFRDQATLNFESRVNSQTGGFMSTFSSWYPTNEAYVVPHISAPGGNILSTVPGGYGILSGTSMAAPFISGVIALAKQSNSKLTPNDLRAILGSTGSPVRFNNGKATSDFLAPIVQQGGGLVNAVKVLDTETVLNKANLALNDTQHRKSEQSFSITNRGSKPITYNFSSTSVPTAYTLDANHTAVPVVQFPEFVPASTAAVTFNQTSIKINAGRTATVRLQIEEPTGLDRQRIPVYGGFLNIKGSNGDVLNLPFTGIASNLKDAKVLDEATGGAILTTKSGAVEANRTFTFSKSNGTLDELPRLDGILAMGSAIVRADLVPLDKRARNTTKILGIQSVGSVAGFPIPYLARNVDFTQSFNGKLADGNYAPAGTYIIIVRALRIFGNPKKVDDYDAVKTVPFTIKYA